ncbi:stage II sporulation protein D [Oceanobacillus iheyensis HTE831]|uniref:Stage II sporulation protein D n=1 Tax=Oceanobacillus iheyensis (strain DSM 14371 / CIP 107618 / JCM 11309 / KCTC 3954 / HTE831) TaxID=221109 RepID=Q8EM96_OCEIH|nr:stage II sporulation protein D [Oceanobacillus iheyensis]BAC14918.1 stage II sporulation protein D [Oceanobacillus iheyensis HTE831]
MQKKYIKRRKPSIQKKIMMLKQKKQPYASHQEPGLKKIVPFRNRKSRYFQNKSPVPWRLTMLSFFGILILFILVVPATVVNLSKDNSETYSQAKENQAAAQDTEQEVVEVGGSPFSVAVMRDKQETVEDVPLEEYVAGVVASEMPTEFELEALKAQAVAARTFTVNLLLHGKDNNPYDLTDTVNHQVYKSPNELKELWKDKYEENMNKINSAVKETKGQIITHNDAPITAAFFSTSNGYTENSEDYWETEVSYLRSVESPWDKEESPKYTSQSMFTLEEVSSALDVELAEDQAVPMEITRTESGRVKNLVIAGKTISGRIVREELDLLSSDFTVEQKNNHLVFTTEGFGHGIGMSQYGANGMAKEGKTYEDIIHYYYKDVEINSVDETAPTLVSR